MLSLGRGYTRISALGFAGRMLQQLLALKIVVVPLAMGLLWNRTDTETQRLARPWLLASACVLLYAPLGPIPHAYLAHPLMLVWAINVAVLVHVVLGARGLAPSMQLLVLGLVLALAISLHPRFCNPRASSAAIAVLASGEEPEEPPTGYTTNPDVPAAAAYPWRDYIHLLEYLRRTTTPQTRVANALKLVPAITGPTARLPAFPAESIAWLTVVRKEDEDRFVAALQSSPNSIVIWAPSENSNARMAALPKLSEAIEKLYVFERNFGVMQVRKRNPFATPMPLSAPKPSSQPGPASAAGPD
jgi:hypothetical protein